MGIENTREGYEHNELDHKFVNALVNMWKKSSLNRLNCEAIELAIELEKPRETKDWRKITILKDAFIRFNSLYGSMINLNMHPVSEWEKEGIVYQFTWVKDPLVIKYQPCTQVYGICFTKDKQILLIDNINMRTIPGGTPEGDETPEQTLRRELIEEADVTVSKMFPLGVQMVIELNNFQKGTYFQYRYVCLIDKLLPQTPDPDNGIIHPRLLIPASEVTSHVKWGVTGEALFKDAIELLESLEDK